MAQREFKEIIDRYIILLGASEQLMEYILRYERKPKSEELEWYKIIHGEDYAKSYFADVNQKRNWLKKVVGTKADQMKKVEADATFNTAVETGNIESSEYKTAYMILDFIGGCKTVNALKSVPKKVYKRLFNVEEKYYTTTIDNTRSYSNVVEPIMKMMEEISYPDFIKNLHL